MPFSLAPRGRILYKTDNKTSAWMTCDLEGKNPEQIMDGLPKFSFPAVSPDGNKILIMKFGGDMGPRPSIVDLVTKKINRIPVQLR